MTTRISLALAILSCCATRAVAEDLNIKPGLWEFTQTMEQKGNPMNAMDEAKAHLSPEERAQMEEAKARMSPEQRAQMEDIMKQGTADLAKPSIKKSCVTKEDMNKRFADIKKEFASDGVGDKSNCKMTTAKSTSTMIERSEECSINGNKRNIALRFVAPNPETLNGTTEVSISGGSGVFVTKWKTSGKWLGPVCGDVKP